MNSDRCQLVAVGAVCPPVFVSDLCRWILSFPVSSDLNSLQDIPGLSWATLSPCVGLTPCLIVLPSLTSVLLNKTRVQSSLKFNNKLIPEELFHYEVTKYRMWLPEHYSHMWLLKISFQNRLICSRLASQVFIGFSIGTFGRAESNPDSWWDRWFACPLPV